MNKTNHFLIQCNAIMLLLGYWLMHSLLSVVVGESTRTASVVYDGGQLALSIYIIVICYKDFVIEPGKSLLTALSIAMMLFSLRMVFDIYAGSFTYILPAGQMWNDVLLTLGSVFFPIWAMISSRKYIDIQVVSEGVFWTGMVTCVFVVMSINMHGISVENERVMTGRGMHTLALAKLGAIEVIAGLHMIVSTEQWKRRMIYMAGLVIGGYVAMASGSRGGVVGVVVAIGVYIVMGMRKKPLLMVMGIVGVVLLVVNLVIVLEWIEGYFPVFSHRMTATVVDGDTSGRNNLFTIALQYITENPILGFGYRLTDSSTGYGAHNGILEILLCFGIPLGLLFTYFIYVKSTIYAVLMMVDKKYVFPSLMAMSTIAASMSGSSITASNFDFSIALLGISYYYYYKRGKNKQIRYRYISHE